MKCGIVLDNELNNDIRVLREIKILKEEGFEIFVLCFGFRRKYTDPLNGIHIKRINIPVKLRDILFFLLNTIPVYEWLWSIHIGKFIRHNHIDILHVHDLYMARAGHSGIKRSKKDVPLILDLHENYPFTVTTYNWTKGFLRRLISRPGEWQKKERKYLGYADRIIVLSADFRDLLTGRYAELQSERFVVLPNVPDLKQADHKRRSALKNLFKKEFPVMLYYGVIAERRGVFDALEVFTELINENQEVNFLLIGPVDKKDKTRFLKQIGIDLLAGRIRYIPWIESSELPDYLEIIDICLAPFHKNPQHESGVANKIYEYMLGGKPIVASNCIPQQILIEKHECGLVFENMAGFKDAVIRLIGNKELRIRMGRNGYEAIFKEYHTGMIKENLISLYKTLFPEG